MPLRSVNLHTLINSICLVTAPTHAVEVSQPAHNHQLNMSCHGPYSSRRGQSTCTQSSTQYVLSWPLLMPLRSVNLHTIINSICLVTAPTQAVEVSQPAHTHQLNMSCHGPYSCRRGQSTCTHSSTQYVLSRPLLMPLRSVNLHTLVNSICLVTAPTHAAEVSQPAHTHQLNMSCHGPYSCRRGQSTCTQSSTQCVLSRPLLMPSRSVNLHTLINSICLVTAPTHAVEVSQPAHNHQLNMSCHGPYSCRRGQSTCTHSSTQYVLSRPLLMLSRSVNLHTLVNSICLVTAPTQAVEVSQPAHNHQLNMSCHGPYSCRRGQSTCTQSSTQYVLSRPLLMPLRSVNLHTIINSICLVMAPTHAVEVSQPAHTHQLNMSCHGPYSCRRGQSTCTQSSTQYVLSRPLLMPLRSVNLHTIINSICLVTAPTHAVEVSQPAHTHQLNMSCHGPYSCRRGQSTCTQSSTQYVLSWPLLMPSRSVNLHTLINSICLVTAPTHAVEVSQPAHTHQLNMSCHGPYSCRRGQSTCTHSSTQYVLSWPLLMPSRSVNLHTIINSICLVTAPTHAVEVSQPAHNHQLNMSCHGPYSCRRGQSTCTHSSTQYVLSWPLLMPSRSVNLHTIINSICLVTAPTHAVEVSQPAHTRQLNMSCHGPYSCRRGQSTCTHSSTQYVLSRALLMPSRSVNLHTIINSICLITAPNQAVEVSQPAHNHQLNMSCHGPYSSRRGQSTCTQS